VERPIGGGEAGVDLPLVAAGIWANGAPVDGLITSIPP